MKNLRHSSLHYDIKNKHTKFEKSSYPRSKIVLQKIEILALFINYTFKSSINDDINNTIQ